MVSDEEIRDNAAAVRKPQPLCQKLVDIANEKGGVDNITIVVVDIVDPAAAQEDTAPAAASAEAITHVGEKRA
jgi:serine/threonine protein phosphatase PrpC